VLQVREVYLRAVGADQYDRHVQDEGPDERSGVDLLQRRPDPVGVADPDDDSGQRDADDCGCDA
jgi:hypothetical protein